jgi:cytochrome c556
MKLKHLALAALAAAVTLPAAAQFRKPQDAVEYRMSVMVVMAHSFGHLGAMANGKAPFDAAQAARDADVVAMMSKLPWSAFVAGSGDVADTQAKPEVWSQADKFKADGRQLEDNAAKLQAAAHGGNLDQIKAQFGATAKSCKACHDTFKKKD